MIEHHERVLHAVRRSGQLCRLSRAAGLIACSVAAPPGLPTAIGRSADASKPRQPVLANRSSLAGTAAIRQHGRRKIRPPGACFSNAFFAQKWAKLSDLPRSRSARVSNRGWSLPGDAPAAAGRHVSSHLFEALPHELPTTGRAHRDDAAGRPPAATSPGLCLLLSNYAQDVDRLDDDATFNEAWQHVGLRLQAATDQHAAMTEELEQLASGSPQAIRPSRPGS